jgi:hypothetical protein
MTERRYPCDAAGFTVTADWCRANRGNANTGEWCDECATGKEMRRHDRVAAARCGEYTVDPGQRFGMYVTTGGCEKRGREWHWEVRCDCGAIGMPRGSKLREGVTRGCCACMTAMSNRRRMRKHFWNGKWRTVTELAKIAGVSQSAMTRRLSRGWTLAKAMTTPPDQRYVTRGGRNDTT